MKLCECGCGLPAPLADRTDQKRGYVKGEPMRFVYDHRLRRYPPDAPTYEIRDEGRVVRKSLNEQGHVGWRLA